MLILQLNSKKFNIKFDKVTIDEPELAEYIKRIESYDK